MRAAMEAALQNDTKLFLPRHLGHLAIAHAALGEAEVALGLLEEANDIIDRTGERLFEPKSIGSGVSCSSAFKDRRCRNDAGACADSRAHPAGAMWELRAATNLARLWG